MCELEFTIISPFYLFPISEVSYTFVCLRMCALKCSDHSDDWYSGALSKRPRINSFAKFRAE